MMRNVKFLPTVIACAPALSFQFVSFLAETVWSIDLGIYTVMVPTNAQKYGLVLTL
jgi:hypothetical protein